MDHFLARHHISRSLQVTKSIGKIWRTWLKKLESVFLMVPLEAVHSLLLEVYHVKSSCLMIRKTYKDFWTENKEEFSPESYTANEGGILTTLHFIWGANKPFLGKYIDDYNMLTNNHTKGTRTAWLDKYTSSVYSIHDNNLCRKFELQPFPDYLRWLKTGELHYLPLEERCLLKGEWDNIPGVYIPTKVVNLCLSVVPKPDDTVIHQISLLSWITPREVTDYIAKLESQLEIQTKSELERRRWKMHSLYKCNTKDKLKAMCRSMRIPVTPSLAKHTLVKLICKKKGEVLPSKYTQPLYHGKLSVVPSTTTAINKLTIHELRAILKHHGYSVVGSKDQLVLRVFMLRHNKRAAITAREEEQLKDLIQLTYKLIFEQRALSLSSHVYRKRAFTLQTSKPHFVSMPNHIHSEQDLKHLFQPFLDHVKLERLNRESADKGSPPVLHECSIVYPEEEQFNRLGQRSKFRSRRNWLEARLVYGNSATIFRINCTLVITYSSEPGQIYEEELTSLVSSNKIRLVSSPL